ncbi:MAG: hypothetical protein K2X27_05105 [Candidatus Obscuribacterales bacterium]|nr:hypothetical protein [Candidatus Obscuribacterales bacterium]
MAEALTGESQQNSPARQLLAALTRASQDMEKSVQENCDYVSKLNFELERQVRERLEQSSRDIESFVNSHNQGISAEKESILAQLTELRQEELRVLQNTGKELRNALLAKLDSLLQDFHKSVDEHVQSFQRRLEEAESGNQSRLDEARAALKEKLPSYLETIRTAISKERAALDELQSTYQKTLSDASNASSNELSEHCAELKTRLDTEGEDFLSSIDGSTEALLREQNESLKSRIEAFSSMEKKAAERIDSLTASDLAYVNELPASFAETCSELTELHLGLHATNVKNLALQYRTEILSAAQEAEDYLQIVKNDLQSQLQRFQKNYAGHFENLLRKFEKCAREAAGAAVVGKEVETDQSQILEKLNEQFVQMKKLVQDGTRDKIAGTETHMEQSYEEFRVKLENSRRLACEKIEASFKDSQDELSRLQTSNEEQLNDLGQKLAELEQSVGEAKELIRALDQASLDF